MSVMENLKAQYVKAVKSADILCQYEGQIQTEIDSGGQDETKKAVNSVALLTNLSQEMDCTEFKMLTNTVLIGKGGI